MEFSRIKKEVKSLEFETLRTDKDNYFEAVFVKEELVKLNARLHNFFGEPAWPSKDKFTSQMQEVIKDFGGIKDGQTLYFSHDGANSVFAMLWPWQDGVHTTIKIIHNLNTACSSRR